MRPPRDEDAPLIAALYSRDWPEPMPVERVLRELASPTLDRVHDARVTDTAFVMLVRRSERAWLRLAGEVTPELLAWAEGRAREAGVSRMLAATWNVGGRRRSCSSRAAICRRSSRFGCASSWKGEPSRLAFPTASRCARFARGTPSASTGRISRRSRTCPSRCVRRSTSGRTCCSSRFPSTHPDLWFLAEDGDELAGIALCDPHPTAAGVGHVGVLGVRAPWRGRGLGLALLEHAFAAFAARGFRAVILGAEADSPTGANRVYERAGMRTTHRRARYQKLLA